ncbi:nuclease-related domain-containing protein [Neobacillus niacini]|uniref:nuclease-related domain-containing protein n=1 Tax=Neobacillus niacini TaxID=86668 RepID=UPI0021CB1BDB|nr:nuclease-related domain-containing protein [Neobacillus niacini]MCM3767335.1 NERD domain-containing protein [Neobacillus niacini]
MLKKSRQIPKDLRKMRILNARMSLLEQDKRNYYAAEKGYEGEVRFDELTARIENQCYIINGLLLKLGSKYFQIDTVLIYQRKIYLIDVKNFEGEYIYEPKKLKTMAGKEIDDPLIQLQRCESLFRQLLQQYGLNFHIEAILVYINPDFTLYQAPPNDSVILPSKLKSFMKKLNTEFSTLTKGHENLANLLISLDLGDYPYSNYPAYTYEGLQKGIISSSSHKLSTFLRSNKIVCRDSGVEESVESAVLRSVEELMLLFPDLKVTTNLVFEWCGMIVPKKTIRQILLKNYQLTGYGRWTFFTKKE